MIPVKVLAVRILANATPALCQALGAPKGYPALGLITTDCDDATYIALDAATKAAEVEVAYGRSFYAGAANASTPNAGEVIGILAGATPGAVRSGRPPPIPGTPLLPLPGRIPRWPPYGPNKELHCFPQIQPAAKPPKPPPCRFLHPPEWGLPEFR